MLASSRDGFAALSLRPRFVWRPRDASVLPEVLRMTRAVAWSWDVPRDGRAPSLVLRSRAMWTRESLVAHVAGGASVDFVFFWGHTPKAPSAVDASCLSQWFPAAFVGDDGARYATAEHFMMAAKARLFGDGEALARVLASASPADAKRIGREVRGYDDARWGAARGDAVVRGNVLKFGQHPALRAFLLATGERVLVEAAPRDRVWGIGMGASNPDARDPARWRGQNLLGFALMEARARLAAPGNG